MFVAKGYCRFCDSKCRHLKIIDSTGICNKLRKRLHSKSRDIFASLPQNIPKEGNIRAPFWCPKKKH